MSFLTMMQCRIRSSLYRLHVQCLATITHDLNDAIAVNSLSRQISLKNPNPSILRGNMQENVKISNNRGVSRILEFQIIANFDDEDPVAGSEIFEDMIKKLKTYRRPNDRIRNFKKKNARLTNTEEYPSLFSEHYICLKNEEFAYCHHI
ncbi:6-phosphogluconate dehydrogenase, decarboxylating [Dirofilaria immitis]